jgi:hypothetical protein
MKASTDGRDGSVPKPEDSWRGESGGVGGRCEELEAGWSQRMTCEAFHAR